MTKVSSVVYFSESILVATAFNAIFAAFLQFFLLLTCWTLHQKVLSQKVEFVLFSCLSVLSSDNKAGFRGGEESCSSCFVCFFSSLHPTVKNKLNKYA